MPVIKNSPYNPGLIYRSGHFQTIYPTLFRKVEGVNYKRKRIQTPDDDFIDLDFSEVSRADSAVIICHGLEGSSDRAYMRGMAAAFNSAGIDAVCYNYRGCSGVMNRQLRMYNAGATDDLELVVKHVLSQKKYKSLILTGFSLGGNLVLKYAGERSSDINKKIKSIIAISAPCDLHNSSIELHKIQNYLYQKRFIIMLKEKIELKKKDHPELEKIDLNSIKTLWDFDDRITAPLHGFKDALDYWTKSSSAPVLEEIRVPALILNALDDPILGKKCYPFKEAADSKYLYLEAPEQGGHVGFMSGSSDPVYYSERRAVEFALNY
jgi:predicted alpha/beta-fold hydrolase